MNPHGQPANESPALSPEIRPDSSAPPRPVPRAAVTIGSSWVWWYRALIGVVEAHRGRQSAIANWSSLPPMARPWSLKHRPQGPADRPIAGRRSDGRRTPDPQRL